MKEKRQTILIAEDNEINRKILAKMLCDEYNVIEAVNGEEAIDKMTCNLDHISALLLDIVMPMKNGYEVLQYLQEKKIVHIPIVVMTGEADVESETKALDLGAWDFVSKPYKPRVLMTL